MTRQSKKKRPSIVQSDSQRAERRGKLLSIVGMGQDSATDVAERHDVYFAEAIWQHLKEARREDVDKKT